MDGVVRFGVAPHRAVIPARRHSAVPKWRYASDARLLIPVTGSGFGFGVAAWAALHRGYSFPNSQAG